ncbi:MAG: T9SS type A sorting domain-containing protein [Bacteroidetes bacterium]|nr:T9SS type A sorting domain-containing protein [Bacteroidota bacterium]
MKKNLFSAVCLCLAFTYGFSQTPKIKNTTGMSATTLVERNANDPNDVSGKSTIRFNTDIVSPAQMDQMNLDRYQAMVNSNPNYDQDRNAYEQALQTYLANNANSYSAQMTITVPVVVHVVYNGAVQNISDNQVLSQIQVVNEDYGRTNSDVNTHWSQAANTTIQFCLAQRTPAGAATNGIERRSTTTASWTTNDNVKHFSSGGLDAWDPTRYMNIWVCNLGAGLLGYGEFPTGTVSNTMGVVILYSAFGSNYTSYGTFADIANPYDRGRTVTHEFSHCLNLYHIWGDDGGSCSGSDQCADTPNQADATTTCFTFPHTDACSASNPGIMFENYMDYSYDNCLNLFTAGQKARMLAVLSTTPYNALTTSNGCQSPVSVPLDAGITAILSPGATVCGLTFTPSVTIKNFGTSTLTSAVIHYQIDAATPVTYNWSGSLATNATANVTLSSMTTTAGTHTFTSWTTAPNAGADGNTVNDQTSSNFNVIAGANNLPYAEGFESATWPPAGCTINNPDAGTTWARTTAAAKTGVASAYMDDFNYNAAGQIDELVLPNLNLSSALNPTMTFQVAYRMYTNPTSNPNYTDTLRVMISTDCGATWTQLYFKYGANLTTATPNYSTTLFVPTAAQWRLETISLTPYAAQTNAMIKFKHTCDYENQMYIDDVNIMAALGINGVPLSSLVNFFPNPSNDGMINMNLALAQQENVVVTVTDALGQTVKVQDLGNTIGGTFGVDLSSQSDGIYFVTVQAGEEKTVQRIVISR